MKILEANDEGEQRLLKRARREGVRGRQTVNPRPRPLHPVRLNFVFGKHGAITGHRSEGRGHTHTLGERRDAVSVTAEARLDRAESRERITE